MIYCIYIYSLLSFNNVFASKKSIDSLNYYNQAINIISDYSKHKHSVYVSSDVLSFVTLGVFFKEEVSFYLNLNENEYQNKDRYYVIKYNRLKLLGYKKRRRIKIYFSEQKDNIFFAEVINSPKNKLKYLERPYFGESNVFMFKIENNIVKLLKSKKILYN
ncbi:MAG: hypothetical protein EAZ55_13650 [Cytophagales bacterium]|nr:MAG: hypothetical protein EAZ55_13650 [Cytophagales bacterium]